MTTPPRNTSRLSLAMERTGKWVFSKEIPSDITVVDGEANFSLHKFMLVAKSGFIRKKIMESKEADLTRIDLSGIPGGPEIFETAAKFCYGVNFEINVQNVAALRCAAEYLEMTENYFQGNLVGRTEDFLTHAALNTLSGAVAVLKSCELLLPFAEELNIVQRCVDAASFKACNEANFPSRSPTNWWSEELTVLDINSFRRVLSGMKSRNAKILTLVTALMTYTERSLPDLVRNHTGNVISSNPDDKELRNRQCDLLESIVALFPQEKAAFPVNFLCCLLRSAIFLSTSISCKNELEKRISAIMEHVTVDDLLVLTFSYDGERLLDLQSVRRIISGFVEKEKSVAVFNAGDLSEICSPALQRVAKTVDSYLGDIATYGELTISKFNGIANLMPKAARKVDDDLYRAVDIFLKAHPTLDEIEREKVCSVMDALKLSYEARVHASQNKRLPVQIVLHALYYDQLKLRSGVDNRNADDAVTTRSQLQADVSLLRENEALKSELVKMKLYISDMQNNQGSSSAKGGGPKKSSFFSSVSKTLGKLKLNPFRNGSKDTLNIDEGIDVTKPRRRRFSIS